MNYKPLFILLLLIVGSCSKEVSLRFSSEEFTEENLDVCQEETCSTVTINYLTAEGDPFISEKINTAITNYVIEGLFLGEDAAPTANSIPEAAEQFVMSYRDHQPDFPDQVDPENFEAMITMEATHQSENFVSLSCYKYLFTGGAHGYGETQFLLFDTQTGSAVGLEDLVNDVPGFKAYAASRFREIHDIAETESINATGFWFEDDQFYLPEAIGLVGDQIVLVYNPYEIASYAEGAISLEIPLNDIEPFLNTNLL
ncbi:MAG: DUF4163 domain-containing protein [Bacteroidota bacterium]